MGSSAAVIKLVSENQEPASISWVERFERGVDPWHPDAFIGTPAEGVFVTLEERKNGWYALDWCGNVVGFIPDGTPTNPPDVTSAR